MPEWLVSIPLEGFVDKYAFRHRPRIVELRDSQVFLRRRRVVSKRRSKIPWRQLRDRSCEGIEEKPAEIEPMSFAGFVGPVHAVSIELARLDPLYPNVPYVASVIAHRIQIDCPRGRCVFGWSNNSSRMRLA